MAYEEALTNISIVADGDQSGNQYKFMKLGADGIDVQDSSGAACVGVLQTKPADGTMGAVAISGISKMVAGAALTRGAAVQSDAQGRAIAAVSGGYPQGVAVEAASAAGEIVPVLLRPQAQIN
jgi:hypothetical protein